MKKPKTGKWEPIIEVPIEEATPEDAKNLMRKLGFKIEEETFDVKKDGHQLRSKISEKKIGVRTQRSYNRGTEGDKLY